jgi:hypothetical protein
VPSSLAYRRRSAHTHPPVNPVTRSPRSSALLDTAPPPTPRSRSEISGASRRWPRGAVAAVSHLTTRFVRTETSSGQSKRRVDLLLHIQLTERCTGLRDTGGAGVGTRHVPGLGCPARREDLGTSTRRMASRHPEGGSHELDRVLGRCGRHHWRRAEDVGHLIESESVQGVPYPQAWTIRVGPRRGRWTLAEHQQPPGPSEGSTAERPGGASGIAGARRCRWFEDRWPVRDASQGRSKRSADEWNCRPTATAGESLDG